MPLVKRYIPYALRLADKDLYGQGEAGAGTSNGPKILRDVNMGSMAGTLQQLGYLAAYSSEMFQELLILTEEVSSRAVSLKERCATLKEKLPNTIARTTNAVKGQVVVEGDDAELLEALRASRASANQAQAKETMSILLPQSMPLPLAERYYSDEVTPMPALERIDECLGDVGLSKLSAKGLSTYSFEYSYPGFFYEEWQRLESQRLDRLIEEKKQRKTERRARKKREAELAVAQNEIGGANALAKLDEGTAAEHQELGGGGSALGPQKSLKGSLAGRHKKPKRSEPKERQKRKKSSPAVAMVSHETVVVEDLDPTKDALVYQRDEFEEYLVPSYPTDLQKMPKPKQHDVASLEKFWDSSTLPHNKRPSETAAHFAFMPKGGGSQYTAGGHTTVQATESSPPPVTPPTVLPQGQAHSTDESPVPSPATVPLHSRILPLPPTPAPVGPEATAALFATKRKKQHTPITPSSESVPQLPKETASVPLVAPPPPPVPKSKLTMVGSTTVASAMETPEPERTEKTLTAPPPPPIPVISPAIRPPPPALPAEMPVRSSPFVCPPPPPPRTPDDNIVTPLPLPSKVIPISPLSTGPSPPPKPPATASPQPSVFQHSVPPRTTRFTPPLDPSSPSSSSEMAALMPSPPSSRESGATSESMEKLPTIPSLPSLPEDDVDLSPPPVPPPAPPEKALELSELVKVLPSPSIPPPAAPAKAIELTELVEVLQSQSVSTHTSDHVEHAMEESPSSTVPPSATNPPLKPVKPVYVPPVPTGIAPGPPTWPSSDAALPVPVPPPPPPMTAQMLDRKDPGLSSAEHQVFHESISVTSSLGPFNDDSLSYNEDSIQPLSVTHSSRGIGDLESIKGGAQLKKVEPDIQQSMPLPSSLGAFANPGINTILERRKYLEADDSDSETDSDDEDDWE